MATPKTKVSPSYNSDYDEEDLPMHNPKQMQQTIYIERRELIGQVHQGDGKNSMVGEAFLIAGEYLNEHAAKGSDPFSLEFEFENVKFIAAIDGNER